MKLIYKVALRLSLAMIPLLALWTTVFYFKMVDEINDETDDSLEHYSERLIIKHLSGETLPQQDNGTNNSFSIVPVTEMYADSHNRILYFDENIYVPQKREYEPARSLVTIFEGNNGVWYELKVSTPTFEREDLLQTILGWILLLYIVILVTGILVTMLIFKKSMSPLYTLLCWLDKYVPGKNISVEFPKTDITEFRTLNKAAKDAAARMDEIYLKQKEFIGNASHELQTPLAVLGNRMEWMLNNSNLTEEQMEEIIGMLHTQRQAVRLNKDLLLLTKIDNMQFLDITQVDIVPIINESVGMYSEIFEEKHIKCTIQLPEKFVVAMNSSLASVLVTNLVRNAYIHSDAEAIINIELVNGILYVKNSGDAPLDGNAIFERFYQGKRKEGSTGLGLSIAKAVCDTCGLSLRYSFTDGFHLFAVEWSKVI